MKNTTKKIYMSLRKDLLKNKKRLGSLNSCKTYGIKTPVMKKILRGYRDKFIGLEFGEVRKLSLALYKSKISEEILSANYILEQHVHKLTPRYLSFLNKLASGLCGWWVVDDFCIDVLQPVFLKYPKEMRRLLIMWNRSRNMWKRRASVVVFVRKVGESGKFTGLALKLCENLIWDKEDLVQKGVGWALKDTMKGDKKRVLKFVKTLRKKKVPSTITLYALRGSSAERRTVLRLSNPVGSFIGCRSVQRKRFQEQTTDQPSSVSTGRG